MADISIDNIKSKIEKLLALSNSPNPEEAASALAKANKLLLDYNIEMSEVTTVKTSEVGEETVKSGFALRDHETLLINIIARLNFCSCLLSSKSMYENGRRKTETAVKLIGKKHNIEGAKVMIDYVFDSLEKAAVEVKGEGRTVVFSYKVGFCTTLTNRINKIIEDRKNKDLPNSDCTALVLVNTEKENKDFIADKYGATKTAKMDTPKASDVFGYMAGQLAAQKLSLNQQIAS